ncbi:GntR family transcriptional regulator [Virgibacillus sediminis]|uniref:GntR family transcriptional regulator n=1 Tax=Virgibacillus sediminis TaxID=202260 RepID=A0ABV7A3G0_9BACI
MTTTAQNIDRSSSVPLYKQIKEILIAEIREGKLDPDRPISTEEELVRRFRVSRAPVRQALKDLANEGYVYRERAKGTFPVRDLPIRPPGLELGGLVEYLRKQGMESESRVLNVEHVAPPKKVRDLLDLEPSEKVLEVSRVIYVRNKPIIGTQTYLRVPETFQPSKQELEKAGSVFVLLERDEGIYLSRGEQQIWATGADIDEARTLNVSVGDPVLLSETLMYTRSHRLIGWRRGVHLADEYKYSFTVSR